MAKRKREGGPKVGDTYLVRVTVANVWDGDRVTLDFPAYGTPITLPATALERDDFIAEAGRAVITRSQCRAARALVNWNQQRLADAAGIGINTLRDFEGGKRNPITNNLSAIHSALEAAGVEFIERGVHLK